MPRFFATNEDILDDKIFIRGDDAYHIARALRMAVGDSVTVSDGRGKEYLCTLSSIRDELCECKIDSRRISDSEPPVSITLFMAYPKGDKLELVIQKAVELGAVRIVPFESSRCIKRPKKDKADKTTARLQRIADEAAKQCRRAVLPRVLECVSYKQMLQMAAKAELPLFCYEAEENNSIYRVLSSNKSVKNISITVGCEGGFSPEEVKEAVESGLISISLGRRILRCETAPIFALSAISYEFEL